MDCIANHEWLYDATLTDAGMFDYLVNRRWLWMTESSHARLMWEGHMQASSLGNRCKMPVRHALLLALVHMKKGNGESGSASEFLTSQIRVPVSGDEQGRPGRQGTGAQSPAPR